jgi:hypothetical protein
MIQNDNREDGILVAHGSFAEMEAEGETLTDRWTETIAVAAEVTGKPVDQALRALVGWGWDPQSPEFADPETREAIGEALCGFLFSYRPVPAQPKPEHIMPAVSVMTSPDWSPFWCAVQAMCLLHGINEEAATSALFAVEASDSVAMGEPAFRAAVVATASLFIQHSETLH